MLPGSSEMPYALALIARREGHWDESIAHFEQALALDPRNVLLLSEAAETHCMVRQFPAALKLYDRALDITPNDPELMAVKARIYQAQGNLQEAARFLSEITWQTSSDIAVATKVYQLQFERNYGEAIRLLQVRLGQFHYGSPSEKAAEQLWLALAQRLAGDTAGAKVTAEQAGNALEQFYRDKPDSHLRAVWLSLTYAVMGERDSALKTAERATMLLPRGRDASEGYGLEEHLAIIQTIVGENGRAISTLTELLQTPYDSYWHVPTPITPALLRVDPVWDPLRADPAFQKLCDEKQPPATP
jgi:serine/threonine-protein kinase